ncbi:MAG: hypothetical protein J6Y63_03390 [Bacteroidales bacterium]|nr:hypothetical protein [Bacteroidales bacterium]
MQNQEDTKDLDRFEQLLEDGLVKICSGAGLLPAELVRCPDIDGLWDVYIKDYIADAVVNFNEYPEAALGWAGFLGLGVAWAWDSDWQRYKDQPYRRWYGARGWDDMDEHILRDVLGLPLDSHDARKISDTLQSCALAVLGLLQHEGVETQTARGFYLLARAYTVLYRVGAAIELHRLGYKKVLVG